MWSYKSLSHNCVPKTCLKNKYRQNPICQNRLWKQPKKCLGINIAGKDVFESIISRPASPPPAPFVFSSTLVEKKKAPLLKASTVLNKAVSPSVTLSSNTTKTTKAPSLGPQRKSSSRLSPQQQNKTSSTKPSPNKPTT